MNLLAVTQTINYLAGKLSFLTTTPTPVPSNPADFLNGPGNGMLDGVETTAKASLAEVFQLISIISFGVLVIVGALAFLMFGVMKHSSAIQENKQWIVRVLIAVMGVAGILTIVGIVYNIGASFK